MKLKLLILFTTIFCIVMQSIAQVRQVGGKVTSSADGSALSGVSVSVLGTSNATQTDGLGNYILDVAPNGTLVFTSIGFVSQRIAVNNQTTINIQMQVSAGELDEVVVTALGITREKKSLGYATQQVAGAELTKNNDQNFLNALSGKIAGVQITAASGAVGASSRIVLRGNNSFGSNQPLFVVDGVPISNSATAVGNNGSVDYGSAIQEIDPNNIESINVLKGANAAALYGSRAANGVIMITTKTGKGTQGLGITYSGGFSFEKVALLPEYQNKYGQGSVGSEYDYKLTGSSLGYKEWAETNGGGAFGFAYFDGQGNGVRDDVDESWGPRLDIGIMLPQFNSPIDASGNRTPTPWVSHPNNIRDYFSTGYTFDNNLSITSNHDKGTLRFSFTNQKQAGTIPNTDQMRNTVQVSALHNVTDKLSVDAMLNYVRTDNGNLIGQGYNSYNPLNSLGSWFGRQIDMNDLKANTGKLFDNEFPYNWISLYHDNPFSVSEEIFNQSRNKDRLFGYFAFNYKFDPWAKLMLRVGDDVSYENREEKTNQYQIDIFNEGKNGNYMQREYFRNEINADLMLSGQGSLSEDFSLNYTAGGNFRHYKEKYTMIFAEDLVVAGIYNIRNVNGNPQANNTLTELRSNSLFAQASLGFREQLFLDVSGRNDWSSTLPKGNWSYFYPSASLSWIFTETFNLKDSFLNFGKLRGGWAQVGNATSAYQTLATYVSVSPAFGGVPMFRVSESLPPLNLKPEEANSTEIGLELGALKNRLRFEATWYNKITSNQIMNIALSKFTGANSVLINAGEIQNKGLELRLGGTIIDRGEDGFQWDIDANWANNKNKVNELYADPVTGQLIDNYPITSVWGVNISAVPGEEFGVMKGRRYRRNDEGAVIVNASSGLPMFDNQQKIGNITPDWIGGVTNSFSYRGFSLSFLLDMRKGGDVFSVTDMFSTYTGVLKHTAEGDIRERGIIVGKDVLQEFKVVTSDGKANDIPVKAANFFKSVTYNGGGSEYSVIDGSYIKLRNINFTYRLPSSVYARHPWLKGAGVSVFANNVALLYKHKSNKAGIDPETGFGVGNDGLGIEQYQIPTNRSIGLKLNVAF